MRLNLSEVHPLNSKEIVKPLLNVKTDIPCSDKMEDPSVIDSTGRINMVFSEDLDVNTVSDGIKLYKVKSDWKEVEEDIIINIDENSPSVLYISKPDNTKFAEGEEYKLSITGKVKSLSGTSLKEEFTSYFTVDYSFNLD